MPAKISETLHFKVDRIDETSWAEEEHRYILKKLEDTGGEVWISEFIKDIENGNVSSDVGANGDECDNSDDDADPELKDIKQAIEELDDRELVNVGDVYTTRLSEDGEKYVNRNYENMRYPALSSVERKTKYILFGTIIFSIVVLVVLGQSQWT